MLQIGFETPAAFWALSSLALLVLFSLWRQAAARATVPSLLLWRRIPERNPPMRALRRPRWRIDLLLQAAAAGAIVAGLAGPYLPSSRPKPRRVAIVLDTSARMLAGDRLEKAKAEARALLAGPLSGDATSLYAAVPSPRRLASVDEARAVHARVDLVPLVAAARQEAEHVIVFSDGPVEGAHLRLLAGPADNAGIVELGVSEGEVFARLVNHGASRRATLRVAAGDRRFEEALDLPPGVSVWHRKMDLSGADSAGVELALSDGFPLDDRAFAYRLGSRRTVVSVVGRHVRRLIDALEAVPGVVLRQDSGESDVAVGVAERPGPAPLRVWLHDPSPRLTTEALEVGRHPLTAGLEARGAEIGTAGVGELAAAYREGEPLLSAEGRRVAVARGGDFHLAADLGPRGLPSTASFPIFWSNVIDFARKGGGFAVLRTGKPFEHPGGTFLEHDLGEHVLRLPAGERRVFTSLLDPRESDTAGLERALDWEPADPAGREPVRRMLGGAAAAAALGCALLAWLIQRRSD
jgi:hypothetical protein